MPVQQVWNLMQSSDTARLNLLTNGGFEIWQRGNGPFTTNNAYSADRWTHFLGGTSTISISKTTSGSSGPNVPTGVMAITYSHNVESYITQYLQQADRIDYVCAGRTITFALDVWCNAANAVRLRLATNGSGALNVLSAYATGDSAWHRYTVTGLVPNDATTVTVGVSLMASCTAYLENATLVVGSVPADYAPLHPADDLARCLRYYQRWDTPNEYVAQGSTSSGTAHYVIVKHQARTAVTSTVTSSPVANLQVVTANYGAVVNPSAVGGSGNMGLNSSMLVVSTAAAFNTAQFPVYLLLTSGGWIALEANP